MPNQPISINLDRMVDAMLDTRTPHYWDPKRSKIVRGSSDLDDDRTRRVLIDTIGKRKFKQLTDGFAKTIDPKDGKLVQEAVKGSFDKFNRLLQKRADLKKAWIAFAGEELMEAAVDWLAMQGIEEFIATGEIAKFALEEAESADEEEEDEDDDEDEEELEEEEEEEEEDEEEEDEEDEEEDLDEDEEEDEEFEENGEEDDEEE
ncbi:MAG: hypothetical protein KDB32_04400 [Planctomycetes bacterium]|nr:hypothetical protein [Planctomycetota bacterium]